MRHQVGKYLFYLFIMILIVGFFRLSALGGWDEGFYWAQLTSIWHDGDLTLHNDLLANWNSLETQYRSITFLKPHGAISNAFSIGTALVDGIYAGPLVFVHRLFGLPRMSALFLKVIGVTAIVKIWVLFLALERVLQKYHQQHSSLAYFAIFSTFCGTPILFYGLNEYGMSHLNSGLLATLFVLSLLWWLDRPDRLHSVALGITAGSMLLIRWQDSVYAFLVIPPLLYQYVMSAKGERHQYLKGAGIVVCIVLLFGSMQCAAWYKQFGELFLIPQGETFMKWTSPQWSPLLFSGYHGLIPWSPVVIVALFGIGKALVSHRGLWWWFMVGSLLTILATIYVNACAADWWGGVSYGARRFCCLLPLFALGVLEALKALNKKAALVLCLCVVCWAFFTYTCFQQRIDDLAVPIWGSPSRFAPASDPSWITDAGLARTRLTQAFLASDHSGLNFFGSGIRTCLDRVVIAIGTLCFVIGLFVLWRTYQQFRTTLVVLSIGYVVSLTCLIAVVFPDSYRLNMTWKHFLEKTVTPEAAIAQGIPGESVRFIQALSFVSEGNLRKAQEVLTPIQLADYRNLRLDKLIEFLKEKAQSG